MYVLNHIYIQYIYIHIKDCTFCLYPLLGKIEEHKNNRTQNIRSICFNRVVSTTKIMKILFWLKLKSSYISYFLEVNLRVKFHTYDISIQFFGNTFPLPKRKNKTPSKIKTRLGGGFRDFFMSIPTWGNDPIWLIFVRWVGSTTNQKTSKCL